MKRFLPSSVMLTPFVVKYYDNDALQQDDDKQLQEPITKPEPLAQAKYDSALDFHV